MDNNNVSDLVFSALEQKPSDFEAVFNDLVVDRIRDAVEQKKIDIAQQMYGYQPEVEADQEETEELDTEEQQDAEELE
jgi:predicted  nucleic acid-binding Zn-ribbon protein